MAKALVVFTNVPDSEVAEDIARELVEAKLAVCVNILPEIHSFYRWQGEVQEADEVTLLIKTTEALYQELEKAIVDLHPYDIPEIIAVPVVSGLPAYIGWMCSETLNPPAKNEAENSIVLEPGNKQAT